MSSAAVGTHSGAGPLSLMSCVRESSPLQDYEIDSEKNVATKRRFWNPKKWFKKKHKANEDAVLTVEINDLGKDSLRSRSTSELSITDEQQNKRRSGSMHPALSVSHDSVFHSPNSGSDVELDAAQSSSSLSISQPQADYRLQTELSERLRLRRGRGDTSEDDEGLPHSPCNSPTTADALIDKTAIKDLPTKSHSTCSDGSLLSMGSSEMDEESFGQHSRYSSKLSLYEKNKVSDSTDSDLELGSTLFIPLNHSAAHHKVAVRPNKRRAPRRNRVPQLTTALPTTPEVNEESSVRSVTPEVVSREAVTELYSSMNATRTTTITESHQLKCSSLPPGLVAPGGIENKLNRSRSNAGSKSQEHFAALQEDVEKEEKSDKSFFDRFFIRRSAKKKKSKEEKLTTKEISAINSTIIVTKNNNDSQKKIETKPIPAPRTGPGARQRIQPIDIPPSPEIDRKESDSLKFSPEKYFGGTSPLHTELENRFKQKQIFTTSPPQSPKISVITRIDNNKRTEDLKKIKIPPGLSSLQQRVLNLNGDDDNNDDDDTDDVDTDDTRDNDGFKSLTDLPNDKVILKPVTKSHSFKSDVNKQDDKKKWILKAASLDSVKHLEEQIDTTKEFFPAITISGPSHTAVFNISQNTTENLNTNTKSEIKTADKEIVTKESLSVTKIQLKRETTQITQSTVTVPKNAIPEFLNRQLNKVETKQTNVVFTTSREQQEKTKIPRKFSNEEIEIVNKEEPAIVTVTPRYTKNTQRKPSISSITPESPKREKPFLKSRSISLDSLKSDIETTKSDDSENRSSASEPVVLRKKSIAQKNEDEPELMKVFARRSLKLKDNESELISEQIKAITESDDKTKDNSDKENQAESPKEERKKALTIIETTEVTLRKPITTNNYYGGYQRTLSLNPPPITKTNNNNNNNNNNVSAIKKQSSFTERRKTTDNWISSTNLIENNKMSQDEIITAISPKNDFISEEFLSETKNFNQRKAEWEKRAQEAQKRTKRISQSLP